MGKSEEEGQGIPIRIAQVYSSIPMGLSLGAMGVANLSGRRPIKRTASTLLGLLSPTLAAALLGILSE